MSNTKFKCLLFMSVAFLGCADIPDDLRNDAKAGDGCNGKTYTEYQFCADGSVYDFCGGTPYNPSLVACCNNHQYTKSTEFCSGITIYRRCGGLEYDPETQVCQNDVVLGSGSSSSSVELVFPSSSSRPSSSSYSSSSKNNVGTCTGGSVTIGSQTWQKCNLDVVPSSGTHRCYNNDVTNCQRYGRLYDWSTAMNLPSSCNSSTCASQVSAKHRGICPSGWHIPSDAEWTTLTDYVGGASTAGRKLKARSGWDSGGNGTDEYGFSALPGGIGFSGGYLDGVGIIGRWWSASEDYSNNAYSRSMYYRYENVSSSSDGKSSLFSVRCVQD